jgi:hypothetical protein
MNFTTNNNIIAAILFGFLVLIGGCTSIVVGLATGYDFDQGTHIEADHKAHALRPKVQSDGRSARTEADYKAHALRAEVKPGTMIIGGDGVIRGEIISRYEDDTHLRDHIAIKWDNGQSYTYGNEEVESYLRNREWVIVTATPTQISTRWTIWSANMLTSPRGKTT